MYVDETMITGHLDHARFSGERFGRILNLLSRSHSVFSTAGALEVSRRMLWWGESRNATSQGVWDAVFQELPPLLFGTTWGLTTGVTTAKKGGL